MSAPNINTNLPHPSTPPLSPSSPTKPSQASYKHSSSTLMSSPKTSLSPPHISGFTLIPLSLIESLTASHAAICTEIQLAEVAIERTLLQGIVLPRPPSGKIYVHSRTLEKNFDSIRKSQEELRKLLNELAEMRGRREKGIFAVFEELGRDGEKLVDQAKTGREERGRNIGS